MKKSKIMSKADKARRYAQGWATRRAKAKAAARVAKFDAGMLLNPAGAAVQEAKNHEARSLLESQSQDPYAIAARAIITTARKRLPGVEADIVSRLHGISLDGKFEAERRMEARAVERLKAVYESNAVQVVAGFLAQMDGVAKANGGPLPRHIVVSGHTLARVIDALVKAGYNHDGKSGDSRDALMGKGHDEVHAARRGVELKSASF